MSQWKKTTSFKMRGDAWKCFNSRMAFSVLRYVAMLVVGWSEALPVQGPRLLAAWLKDSLVISRSFVPKIS